MGLIRYVRGEGDEWLNSNQEFGLDDEIQKQSALQVLTKAMLHIMTDKLDSKNKHVSSCRKFVFSV